ncbi:MAG: amidohydrolase family protein [Gammaproteobacteria bacterium]|nr:amidohydrolase family protein [Gammaproteobacteria bacterium]
MKKYLALTALLLSGPVAAETIAITGATIHTLGDIGTIEDGTIVIDDGVITAIGAAVEIPTDARTISARNSVVTPGLFDPISYLGIVEISLVDNTVDHRQHGTRYSAAFDVAPAINPRSTLIPINRIEGVTRAMVAPAPASDGGSLISGLGAIMNLSGRDNYVEQPRAALFVHLGERGAGLSGGSRAAALLSLREALEDARDYANNRGAYDSGRRRDYALSRYDLEALQPVLDGEIPMVVTVNRASDIEQVLQLAEDERIDVVIRGGAEAWLVADQLAEAGVPVITDPTRNLPSAFESLNASLESAARLDAAGVTVAFSISESHNARNLRQLAGNAVANGMDYEAALRAVTVTAADIFASRGGGPLEVGQRAELVVWDGDPLEVTSFADAVYIDGQEIPMRSRQTLLRDRYLELDTEWPHAYPR